MKANLFIALTLTILNFSLAQAQTMTFEFVPASSFKNDVPNCSEGLYDIFVDPTHLSTGAFISLLGSLTRGGGFTINSVIEVSDSDITIRARGRTDFAPYSNGVYPTQLVLSNLLNKQESGITSVSCTLRNQ